jgi:hypothetical protein
LKKAVVIAFACIMLGSCGLHTDDTVSTEHEVSGVVDKYLDNSAAGNWDEVFASLSGEALAEARANSARAKAGDKIVSRNYRIVPVCRDIVEVSADITRTASVNTYYDRNAYVFRLKRTGSNWLVYNASYGQYHHGQLKPGRLPQGAFETIRTYFELPDPEKRARDSEFLTGKLLKDSRAAGLPGDFQPAGEAKKIVTTVQNVECLGLSDDYGIAQVDCKVVRDGRNLTVQVIVDVLNVNGLWKIGRMDVSRVN